MVMMFNCLDKSKIKLTKVFMVIKELTLKVVVNLKKELISLKLAVKYFTITIKVNIIIFKGSLKV